MHETLLTSGNMVDPTRLRRALTTGPRRYTYLLEVFGGNPDRALAAIDRLLAAGEIERVIIQKDTHYRMTEVAHG